MTAAPAPKDLSVDALVDRVRLLEREVDRLTRRLAEAEGMADRDVLTPLLNRRAFVRELGRAMAFARRHGLPACLVYIDLDGFKRINDAHGHAAGDEALRAAADRLRGQVRESDLVGRLGGDEFAVLLTHADRPAAEAKAETLVRAVAAEPVPWPPAGDGLVLSATWGVRVLGEADTPEQALAEADAAMFLRKPRPRP